MRHPVPIAIVAVAAAIFLSSCLGDSKTAQNGKDDSTDIRVARLSIPSGTSIEVAVKTTLSSEDVSVGDRWSGTVITARDGIPAGSLVDGTVTAVKAAHRGDRAMLELGLTSMTVRGHSTAVEGRAEAIIAGSTRARNLGAIAGSAAAGALVGKAASGTDTGAAVGAVAGAGVATGVVAESEGYQVVLKSGTLLVFTTTTAMAVRL
jgi:hypothetical protein